MPPPIKGWRVGFSALEKLYEKHFKGASNAPAIAPNTAALLSIAYVIIYVVPFYLSSATRPSPQLSRNAPSVIRARIRAVTLSCLVSFALTCYVLHQSHVPLKDALKLLGFWPVSLIDSLRTLLLVAILFAGPLFEYGIVDGEWRDWIRFNGASDTIGSWVGYRNIIFGPANEELVWRSLIIPLHVLAHFSGKQIIFLTPLYFGIAHVHHIYEFRINNPRVHILQAILISLFQFTYTSLFGFFAAFVFLRTGNVYSCFLAHSFCNWMGLPRFYGRVGVVEAGVPIGPPDADKRNDADKPSPIQQQTSIAWTVAYYIILVAGAMGFYWQLFPLTESAYALPVALIEE